MLMLGRTPTGLRWMAGLCAISAGPVYAQQGAVSRVVRAYDPRPGAFTRLRGSDVKLFGARAVADVSTAGRSPGEIVEIAREGMTVACGGASAARILAVHPAGKKRMTPEEWARGRGVAVGDRFEHDDGASS